MISCYPHEVMTFKYYILLIIIHMLTLNYMHIYINTLYYVYISTKYQFCILLKCSNILFIIYNDL